jgi:hypothetical protein
MIGYTTRWDMTELVAKRKDLGILVAVGHRE